MRTAMSRPSVSDPSRYLPPAANHCGPIGVEPTSLPPMTPPFETTSIFFPPTVTWSSTCVLFGPVCATWWAYTEAKLHARTIRMKTASEANATWFRRRRRQLAIHRAVQRRLLLQLGDLRVRRLVVEVRVVVVVLLRDPGAVQQHVEPVERMRVVLEPVGEADLSFRRLVADRRPVDRGV